MRCALLLIFSALAASANDAWLSLVAPIISPAERTRYQSMPEPARAQFREHFFDTKAITAAEYAERAAYVDANFGTGKRGSGSNTDQGRVYLSLGTPSRITHLASSRNFAPLDIWYYNTAPAVGAPSELRLLFYRHHATGLPRLYSPTLDTFRELLLPQPGNVGIFGPNETIDASALQTRFAAKPVESEVLDAAISVAPGVRNEENETVLMRAMSPATALRIPPPARSQVQSRLLARAADLDVVQTASPLGGVQVDLRWKTAASQSLRLEVLDGTGTLYASHLDLHFPRKQPIEYLHRLDLLPGSYTLLLTSDTATTPYPLQVALAAAGSLFRATYIEDVAVPGKPSPFVFGNRRYQLASNGKTVLLAAPAGSRVSWVIRSGAQAVWKTETVADAVASLNLPTLPPAAYVLEASVNGESRTIPLDVSRSDMPESEAAVVSFNANLSPPIRLAFLGNQELRRNHLAQALRLFERCPAAEGLIGLSRVDAAEGRLDAARDRLRPILKADPANFEALTAMAYIEARFQDFPQAASYYRRALAVQNAPAVRLALASLPASLTAAPTQ